MYSVGNKVQDYKALQTNIVSLTSSLTFQRHSGAKKMLYGASEVMNAAQFLKQVGSIIMVFFSL